jgi:hypothetical protein
MKDVVLIQRDNQDQVLSVKGPYELKEGLEILDKGHRELGGELFVPKGNFDWAFQWRYGDYNGTYWAIHPVDNNFKYPEDLE